MDFGTLIIILLVFILTFFACRELLCWYWKVNKSIELQQEILDELRRLSNGGPSASPASSARTLDTSKKTDKTDSTDLYPLVIDLATERQMRVHKITSDGKFVCYSGSMEVGTFSPDEVMDFNEWVQAQK